MHTHTAYKKASHQLWNHIGEAEHMYMYVYTLGKISNLSAYNFSIVFTDRTSANGAPGIVDAYLHSSFEII